MNEETSSALALARTILVCLRTAGYDYQLAGSLALHAHGLHTAARTSDVLLFTEADHGDASPVQLTAEVLRQEQYTVTERPDAIGRSGIYPVLRVVLPDAARPLTVTLQRMPQIAATQEIDGMPTAALEDCLARTVHAIYAGTAQGGSFVDFDAIQAHTGKEPFDRFIQAYLQHRTKDDPKTPPVTYFEHFYRRLAQVIRDPTLGVHGRRDAEALRRSVLEAAGRMLREAPGGSSLLTFPLEQLERVRLDFIVRQFDSATLGGKKLDPGQAQFYATRLLAIEAAVRMRTEAGEGRNRIPSSPHRSHFHPPSAPHTPGHGPAPGPGR